MRLPYLSEFQEIEIRGLRFLHRQDFRLRIGDDPDRGEDGLEICFAIDPTQSNDRVVRCTYRGEPVAVLTEPTLLDFRVKPEAYILRLVREESTDPAEAVFRFALEQETAEGRRAEQASVQIRLPADRVPRGGITLLSEGPWENRWTVSIEEILVRGKLDRARLARARDEGKI